MFSNKIENAEFKRLQKLAKERGLRRYHNLKKSELLTLLEIQISPSKRDLKKLAKDRGLRRYHNLKKLNY